jgi:amino acid adenylation domain-containing protein
VGWSLADRDAREREAVIIANLLFPLTLAQNDICLDQLRHSRSPLYNVGGYIRLGEIDLVKLADAHRRLVSESDVFGLRIKFTRDGIFQTICHTRTTSLTVRDFSSEETPAEAADEWQASLFETSIDIADAELFRAYVVKLADDHYRYVGLAHHVMMDGWGFSNWAKLLCQIYNDPFCTVDAGIAWREIALDDEKYVASEKYITDKSYWAGHVKRIAPSLFIPRHRLAFTGAEKIPSRRRIVELSRADLYELRSLAECVGAGVSHYFLAMLAVYFANSSGQDRLVFGLPFHNRRGRQQKQMLGVFTSVSPLRIDMGRSDRTFGELVQDIYRQQKMNLRHQRYPLGHIIRDLAEPGAHRSLYDVGFNYLKLSGDLSFAGNDAALVYLSHNHEATPLMVTLCEYGEFGPVQLQLDYNLAYFDDTDISLLADRLSFLLRSLRGDFDTRVADLEVLPEDEVRRLLEGFGDGPLHVVSNVCIHHLFEEQVKRTPDAIAIASGEGFLTYGELNRRANHLAHRLISLGVKPESPVGICMERTADLLVGVLGILKSGGAYVPLDKSHPPQRIRVVLEDGGVQFALTQAHLARYITLPTVHLVLVDEILKDDHQESDNLDSVALGLAPSNLAYVIYTSGSTGKPKGVQICHSNAAAFLDWVRTVYTPEELGKVLASTSLSFDLSVFELFAPLTVGGQCVVVRDALDLFDGPVDVSLINTVPSAMKVLIEQNAVPTGVRIVNLAGEPLPMHLVNDLLSAHKCEKVFNLYGPSEDTTYTTYALFDDVITDAPDIGRAIAGTRLYILSPEGRLTPAGAIGELYISGSGVARGYMNSPHLTAERFICNPFATIEGDRLYRTGDLVRYGSGGALEYLGRADDQVKIRGFRIELGEIQRQLEQLDGVKTAVVLARERSSSDRYLAAYVERKQETTGGNTPLSDETWADDLQRVLRTQLPEFMVPTSITVLDEMPLNTNGKVDKKVLLKLHGEPISRHQYVAPKTRTENKLVDLWAGFLGVDRNKIGVTSSLFDLGGHSLLLVRLANDIRVELGVRLSMRALFDVISIRDLAGIIDTEISLQLIEEKMNSSAIVSEGYL